MNYAQVLKGARSGTPGAGGVSHESLPGVTVHDAPKKISTQINAKNVSWSTGGGTEPKDKNANGVHVFDSAPGSFGVHSKEGATFSISGKYGEAKQKAQQQAAAWGHNQLRVAP